MLQHYNPQHVCKGCATAAGSQVAETVSINPDLTASDSFIHVLGADLAAENSAITLRCVR